MLDQPIHVHGRFGPARSWLPRLSILLMFLIPGFAVGAENAVKRLGGWRLAEASSPYLQMHRDNPVEWYPWGEEALARARAENKPLFISIGYFTCHWCHVMERESFRDPHIARLLNENYISIKIDREQRPDLDAAYMSFVVATQGYGGWPTTVLATPDGTPFFGGTYFPPQDRDNAPGLEPLLRKARALWDKDRQNVIEISRQAVEELKRVNKTPPPLKSLTAEPVIEARRQFRAQFDPYNGGFGLAPKFPQPAQLLFLLQDDDPESVDMARYTLDRMAAGGIQDHLEGGFHRYTTDADWRVPHFEKMLYDQALIARAYLAGFRRTGDARFAAVARRILDFTLASLRDRRGGFYSALSADSLVGAGAAAHVEEGAYYIWDWKQLRAAVPELSLRQWAIARYGLKQGGNVPQGSPPELLDKNILYLAKTEVELAQQFAEGAATVHERLAAVDKQLTAARRQRPVPPRDEKIVTAWNGYMITALAEAAQLLNEPRYRRAAEEAARFLLEHLYQTKSNRLYRDWRNGVLGVTAFSEDYAAVAEGLLALYALDGNRAWLDHARRLTEAQIEQFWDPNAGGFYSVGRETSLWMRDKPAGDNVTPSPSAMALGNLLKLGVLTGERRYTDMARRSAAWQGGAMRESPDAMPYALQYWTLLTRAPAKAPETPR